MTDEPQYRREMGVLLGPPFLEGNHAEILVNGDPIFAAMLAGIRRARQTMTFETYICGSESIGAEFTDALSKRVRARVKVHVLLDWIDGNLGFTGGLGTADQWRGNAQDEVHWRDTHFRVVGPVVVQMKAVFIDNWTKATGRVLLGAGYFPPLVARGGMPAQMFSSSPNCGSASMHLMCLTAITAARHSIDL